MVHGNVNVELDAWASRLVASSAQWSFTLVLLWPFVFVSGLAMNTSINHILLGISLCIAWRASRLGMQALKAQREIEVGKKHYVAASVGTWLGVLELIATLVFIGLKIRGG